MAQYQYKENKISNIMNIIGGIIPIIIWFFIPFTVKDFTQLPNGMGIPKQFVMTFQIILVLLLLFIPMGNISRRVRQNSLKIVTNRKGLTVSVSGIEKKFSWHELTNSLVIYGHFPFTKTKEMIPRKLILKKPAIQGQMQPGDIIEIDNNPYGMAFPDMEALVDEIRKNEPKIKQEVIGIENYCPHCKIKIDNNNLCKKCEGNIKTVPRYQKLFYTTKFSAVLFVILLCLTGSKILWISAGIIAILFVILPTFMAYKEDQRIRLKINNK